MDIKALLDEHGIEYTDQQLNSFIIDYKGDQENIVQAFIEQFNPVESAFRTIEQNLAQKYIDRRDKVYQNALDIVADQLNERSPLLVSNERNKFKNHLLISRSDYWLPIELIYGFVGVTICLLIGICFITGGQTYENDSGIRTDRTSQAKAKP